MIIKRYIICMIGNILSMRSCPVSPEFHRIVFKVDRIGDFFLSLGALHALLDNDSGKTALVVSHDVHKLACIEFPNVSVVPIYYRTGRFSEILRMFLTSRLLGLTGSELVCLRHQRINFHNLAMRAIRSQSSYGYKISQPSVSSSFVPYVFTYLSTKSTTVSAGLCHEIMRHKHVLELLGIPPPLLPFCDYLGKINMTSRIIIAPLGGNSIRDIPATLLDFIVRSIRRNSSMPIAICCAPMQLSRLEKLVIDAKVQCSINADLSIDTYINWIASASLVVSADSASAHMAATFDRPLVGLIAGGHDCEFVPWKHSNRQHWLTKRVDCFNCDWKCIYPTPICLHDINKKQIDEAIFKALANDQPEESVC